MEFEEMRLVWDSQKNEPLYAVNRAGLHAMLIRKSRAVRRAVFWQDLREISMGICACALLVTFAGLLMNGEPHRLAEWFNIKVHSTVADLLALFLAGVLWFEYSIYRLIGRKRQEFRERQFNTSLGGDLEREISRADYQIRTTRTVFWWGLLPIWTGNYLFLYVAARLLHLPAWIVSLFAFVLLGLIIIDVWLKQRPIENELLPWKRELESLREKLHSR